MYRLSQIVFFILIMGFVAWGQSPHGDNFKLDCAACHTTDGWTVDMDNLSFDHDSTSFVLEGMHLVTDCKSCHTSLVFEQANSDCVSCHTDIHNMTVGNDCIRCHNTNFWLVDDIPEIHEENGFPLIINHNNLSCIDCHTSENSLQFERIGNECISCHLQDYEETNSPDHQAGNFSMDCLECHDAMNFGWGTDKFNHDFFPLTLGHEISDCKVCHTGETYSELNSECISCHLEDFNNAEPINHVELGFFADCRTCHTTDPNWAPAYFNEHDERFFPIYSGTHQNAWTDCVECHVNESDFNNFNCINCHKNPETSEEHNEVSGYLYEDIACLACHPTGESDFVFDHNTTDFPLTGAHLDVNCLDCHINGFSGTSSQCVSCHGDDFAATINPKHSELNLSMDCASCHTTDPDWMPASFEIHNNFYVMKGAHAVIATDCAACHNGDYVNTPNTCVGCHQDEYNATLNPNHVESQFSTECATCHNEDSWEGGSINHDFYPLLGAHADISNNCVSCHSEGYVNTPNTCVGCHQEEYNATWDPNHIESQFSTDCATCHNEDSWEGGSINHDFYPLLGAHAAISNNCVSCHSEGYVNTPNTCIGCHQEEYNATADPNHIESQFSTDCATCHNEDSWEGGSINHDFYPLLGAHAAISNNCVSCHAEGYVNTPNTCVGCHQEEYNATADPNHIESQFSTDCAICHNEDSWEGGSINHDFYPLLGAHAAISNNCVSCHAEGYVNTPNTCVGCHQEEYNATVEPNHIESQFSTDCATCHNEDSWEGGSINHDFYPLLGAHAAISNNCVSCHSEGYVNTPNTCVGCHQSDFNLTTNPNHQDAQFPTDCTTCHTIDSWVPSSFDHNTIYTLTGAHAQIENNCILCHTNGYSNTPNTCAGCHQSDYNETTNPNHQDALFSTDCAVCHTPDAWMPSTFDHDNLYPLSGAHAQIANNCIQCHADGYSNTPNTCIGCHQEDYNLTTDPNHQLAQFPIDCASCHNESAWEPSTFDHDGQYFPIYSGRHQGLWNTCSTCHTNSSDFSVFTCFNCHEHADKNQVDNDHSEVNGYVYTSNACYSCHPDGRN